jgi:hypothetical protein
VFPALFFYVLISAAVIFAQAEFGLKVPNEIPSKESATGVVLILLEPVPEAL